MERALTQQIVEVHGLTHGEVVSTRWPSVLQFLCMSHTLTIRLTHALAEWLHEESARSGVAQGQIVREQLERARASSRRQSFMRLAGSVRGPADLSARKGFSRR